MKLLKIKKIKGKILIETGLHIGAGNDTIEIGGMDNPIIKNSISGEPYIPGSSIKGKLRSLMEWYTGRVIENNGEPCNCGKCDVCRVFGTAIDSKTGSYEEALKRGPTRLIVRDAFLYDEEGVDDTSKKKFINGETIIEEKSENKINRITAEAKPRSLERVVPGTEFNFELNYLVYNMVKKDDGNEDNGAQDEENFKNIVLKGLALLEESYLGGGGSRGNGKIRFIDLMDEEGNPITLPKV